MQPSSRPWIGWWAQGALLLFLTIVLTWRAVGLAREPLKPTAQREERFLSWAWREPEVGAVLAEVEAALAPGEPVMLALGAGEAGNSKWWRFMASYYLTRNPVVGVKARLEARESAPPEATVVWITPRGASPPAVSGAVPSTGRHVVVLRRGRRPFTP